MAVHPIQTVIVRRPTFSPLQPTIPPKAGKTTYRSAVAHAVWRHDAEAHLQEHGDLVPPAHTEVREAVDLVLGLLSKASRCMKTKAEAHQEQGCLGRSFRLAVKVSYQWSAEIRQTRRESFKARNGI